LHTAPPFSLPARWVAQEGYGLQKVVDAKTDKKSNVILSNAKNLIRSPDEILRFAQDDKKLRMQVR
jgi:hypothetical protein